MKQCLTLNVSVKQLLSTLVNYTIKTHIKMDFLETVLAFKISIIIFLKSLNFLEWIPV